MTRILPAMLLACLLLAGCSQGADPSRSGEVPSSSPPSAAAPADSSPEESLAPSGVPDEPPGPGIPPWAQPFPKDQLPMDESTFSEEERDWINLAESLCIVGADIADELTEQKKAALFQFLISTPLYGEKAAEWKAGDGYRIPLADVEEIIFTHLDTTSFDPVSGFGTTPGWRYYDEEKQAYIANDLGGYGGAAAFGVLQYVEEDNKIDIVLGSYHMDLYFREPREYELTKLYRVELSVADGPERFKLLRAESAVPLPSAGEPVGGSSEESVPAPSDVPGEKENHFLTGELLSVATDFAINFPKPFAATGELDFSRFVMFDMYLDDPAMMDQDGIVWINPQDLADEVLLRFGIPDYLFESPTRENVYPRYVEEKGAIAFYVAGEYSSFLAEFIDFRQEGSDLFYTFDIYDDFITDGHEEKTLERRLCYHFRPVERKDGTPWLQAVSATEVE